MSITKIKTTDKIKLLDQMLEDLAGDEFEEFDTSETGLHASAKQYGNNVEELDMIDSMH